MELRSLLFMAVCSYAQYTFHLPDIGYSNLLPCCEMRQEENGPSVKCVNCDLTSVPGDLPRNTSVLDLSRNPLGLVLRDSFKNYVNIKVLLLHHCCIAYLNATSFENLSFLRVLDLSNNLLESFKEVTFSNLDNLEELYIQNNKYYQQSLNPITTALKEVTNLRVLAMDIFDNHPLGRKQLPVLKNLTRLDLTIPRDVRRVIEIKNDSFALTPSVEYLNITGRIYDVELGTFLPLRNLTGLKFAGSESISAEVILRALYGLQHRALDYLIIRENHNSVHKYSFNLNNRNVQFLKTLCIRHLDISSSRLSSVTPGSVSLLASNFRCVETLDISRNPDLRYMDMLALVSSMDKLKHLNLCCIRNHHVTKLVDEKGQIMRTFHLPGQLESLNISHNDFQDSPMYDIQITNGDNLQRLDASHMYLRSCNGIILGLPALKVFNISFWNCSTLSPKLLSGMQNITHLTARGANLNVGLTMDPKGIFLKGLTSLEDIDMANNNLEYVHHYMFTDQKDSLKRLCLTNNRLSTVPEAIQRLRSLRILELSGNLFEDLDKESRTRLDSVIAASENINIYFGENHFRCTCAEIDTFEWFSEKAEVISDIGDVTCLDSNADHVNVTEVIRDLGQLKKNCLLQMVLMWTVGGTAVIVLTVFVIAICYRIRYKLRYWFVYLSMRRKGYHGDREYAEDEYDYDAYVAYCQSDEDWVFGPFWNKLNEMAELRLFIPNHDKTFDREDARHVMTYLDRSRQIVFVVSWDFLRTSWKTFELEIIKMHALRTHGIGRFVIVLVEHMRIEDMPSTIRNVWGKCNCFSWPREDKNKSVEHLNTIRDNFWIQVKKSLIGEFEQLEIENAII